MHQLILGARTVRPPDVGDRAIRAPMIAPLRDFEIREGATREEQRRIGRFVAFDRHAARRDHPAPFTLGHVPDHLADPLQLINAEKRVHPGKRGFQSRPVTLHHAPRHDHRPATAPLLVRAGSQNRPRRLLPRALDKGAGVDQHHVRLFGRRCQRYCPGLQISGHHLRIHEILRAAETDEPDRNRHAYPP